MREDICTIPINEIFEPKEGCPFCRMRDMLEERMSAYITGAAMMEPDVRLETNRLGFCKEHFDQIIAKGSRLSVALILESLLEETERDVLGENLKRSLVKAEEREKSCFVCANIEKNMDHLLSTVVKLWQTEPEFRKLYSDQNHICLKHYPLIMKATGKMPGKSREAFFEDSRRLCLNYMRTLREDTTHFCRMFDYRSKDGDWGNSKDAIERSVEFLTSRKVTVKAKSEEKNR